MLEHERNTTQISLTTRTVHVCFSFRLDFRSGIQDLATKSIPNIKTSQASKISHATQLRHQAQPQRSRSASSSLPPFPFPSSNEHLSDNPHHHTPLLSTFLPRSCITSCDSACSSAPLIAMSIIAAANSSAFIAG